MSAENPPAVRAVPLSDDEIIEVRKTTRPLQYTTWADTITFARAILAAQSAKQPEVSPATPGADEVPENCQCLHCVTAYTKGMRSLAVLRCGM